MRFYFAGQTNFGNRGCEALIRTTVQIVRAKFPDAAFLVPSHNPQLDSAQWPDAGASGVTFVPVVPYPGALRLWARAQKVIPALGRIAPPAMTISEDYWRQLGPVDAVIVTGGDILSLEYGPGSLYYWTSLIDAFKARGVPIYLWAASVGPFSSDRRTERRLRQHLLGYSRISVREAVTQSYLNELGVDVQLVADPAFNLAREPLPNEIDAELADRPFLGLNISPLVRSLLPTEADRRRLDEEIAAFIRRVHSDTDLDVMLVPHVDALDGSAWNSDSHYLSQLGSLFGGSNRVWLAPPLMNAAQLKSIIGRCRYFMGARTHATIASLSLGIPTLSLAYSVKAKGINQDLFGDLRYVLDMREVSSDTLWAGLSRLIADEAAIIASLTNEIPRRKHLGYLSNDMLFN